jgi:hypothetical protein
LLLRQVYVTSNQFLGALPHNKLALIKCVAILPHEPNAGLYVQWDGIAQEKAPMRRVRRASGNAAVADDSVADTAEFGRATVLESTEDSTEVPS